MPFKVDKCPGVAEKIRALGTLARLAGIRQNYIDALKTMVERLKGDPLGWGDPLYRTKLQGGLVCSGMVGPIIVRFAVHEPEKTVLIMDIDQLYDWPIRP